MYNLRVKKLSPDLYRIVTGLFHELIVDCFVFLQLKTFSPSLFRSAIEVESPTTKIYRFHGAIIHPSGEKIPIGTENLLLRECILKNTDFVEGIVVYAGRYIRSYRGR